MPKVPLNGVEIFYELHCSRCGTLSDGRVCPCRHAYHVLLIMGFQARGDAWRYNLDSLLSFKPPGEEILACWLDNRGVGESSHPTDKKAYSTQTMAKDALGLMDHLGWKKAHVFGHSMGGMISCKLAAMVPDRILSLALISVTGGRLQAVASIAKNLGGLLKHGILAKTSEQKARATLYCHFSRKWLKQQASLTFARSSQPVSGREGTGSESNSAVSSPSASSADSLSNSASRSRRKELLIKEYVKDIEGDVHATSHGADGQASAVLGHTVSHADVAAIKSGGFPILVIHGRKDVIADIKWAQKLARKLEAATVVTDAGHLITRESLEEVNFALLSLMARVHTAARTSLFATPVSPESSKRSGDSVSGASHVQGSRLVTSASAASWSTLSGESDPNQGLAAQEMQRLRDIAVQDSDTSEDEFHDCQEDEATDESEPRRGSLMTAPALSVISAKKGEMSPVLLETAGSSPMMGCFPEPACESQENPGNVRPSSLRLKH